jgi:hypothetical protein
MSLLTVSLSLECELIRFRNLDIFMKRVEYKTIISKLFDVGLNQN